MSLEAVNVSLAMERGDTFAFTVQVENLGAAAVLGMYFTIRRKGADEEIVVQKSLGDGITRGPNGYYRVRVAPEDTRDISPGKYEYDLQINYGGDVVDVKTPIKGKINIAQDVTW